jgi:hypothetical protein
MREGEASQLARRLPNQRPSALAKALGRVR